MVKSLPLRLLMSYIYIYIYDISSLRVKQLVSETGMQCALCGRNRISVISINLNHDGAL